MNPRSNECGIVVFAILDYEKSRALINRTKIEKPEYKRYLDEFKIDTISCNVIHVGNEGIAIKRKCIRKHEKNKGWGDNSDSKRDIPVWRDNTIQIGI